MIKVRNYLVDDLNKVYDLFQNTVHVVNSKDYSENQIKAWINIDTTKLNNNLLSTHSKVITQDNAILGFGNVDDTGYIDMFFIHADYQNKGLGSVLLSRLEYEVSTKLLFVHASITSRAFFEHKGYQVKQENHVQVRGQKFINYTMTKSR
ncbi:GNAT family N-acetyltransferase [Lentilactobacillus kribbianus]|uniref:GNAT family N-acetyltransferase n=1 Tax=Lentilactobacillus kribbianus TaxID=2729622 RepID=UPI00155490DC|nr:GNAT family N-acetyltransferase [Lentilactobacillus kribbianus]